MSIYRHTHEYFNKEIDKLQSKQRFGLFSHPIQLESVRSINKNSNSIQIQERIIPRNFMSGPLKKGKLPSDYFSYPEYIGYEYDDQFRSNQRYDLQRKSYIQRPFKPCDPFKLSDNLQYEHMSEYNNKSPPQRSMDGSVKTQSRGILTNTSNGYRSSSSLGKTFGKIYEHIPEPYEREKELDIKERQEHKNKILCKKPFINNSYGGNAFDNNLQIQEYRPYTTQQTLRNTTQSSVILKKPFYPASPMKTGQISISSKINHVPESDVENTDQITKNNTDQKPWRYNTLVQRTRPTPNIMKHRRLIST